MAHAYNDVDLAGIIPNVTDSLGVDTPPATSSPTSGFSLHRTSMGRETVLVKVYSGLTQGCLSPSESKTLEKVIFYCHL